MVIEKTSRKRGIQIRPNPQPTNLKDLRTWRARDFGYCVTWAVAIASNYGTGVFFEMVNWRVKLGAHALALLLFVVPVVMVCLVPTATLTAAERECCKQMAGQCDKAGMGGSHSCCERSATPEDLNFVTAKPSRVGPDFGTIALLPPVSAQPVLVADLPAIEFSSAIHGPPESPPASISVLRI